MDYNELEQMTVNALREEAKKLDAKGVSGMKKDELLHLLVEKHGIEVPEKKAKKTKRVPTTQGKAGIKQKIVELKELRDKARSQNDPKKVAALRRWIHTLKRRTRKAA